jgi:ketosteroid isomerase-like protein
LATNFGVYSRPGRHQAAKVRQEEALPMNPSRTWIATVPALAVLAFLALAGWGTDGLTPASAAEGPTETWSAADLQAEGGKAVDAWLGALVKHDPAGVAAVLAPEFQIMRSDGAAYGKDDYIAKGLPAIAKQPTVEKLVVTGHGEYLVARSWLLVEETAGGKTAEAHAPRITVFRKSGDAWLVVAHGNFAAFK